MVRRLFISFLICIAFKVLPAQDFNISFRSNLPYPGQTLANIWGYVDDLGNEYALAGASNGLSIVDVTNPDAPFQVQQIPWPVNNGYSLWKEVKTWGKYAYVVSEAGRGLQIIDLSNLPGNLLASKQWEPVIGGATLSRIHALHIDNGFAYLYGSNVANGGVVIVDLSDPWNPTFAGMWNQAYIHDGYVRNDTLYAGRIYDGEVDVIDVRDKANPVLIHSQTTPGHFTHNTWLSDNGKTLFTTDEVTNSFLTAYDITDIHNIIELDKIQATPGSGSIVHNTHILNDWAVNSYYKDGVNIVDGHRPQNLVQVARYDTYPAGSGNGYEGAWGVYPFLPSGNLVVSNIDEGLFVLTPTYIRASYLEGIVTDSITNLPITDAMITITGSSNPDFSKINGEYATGIAGTGTYTVTYTKQGYYTKTIQGISLSAGAVTNLNVQLVSDTITPQPHIHDYFLAGPNPYTTSFKISYLLNDLSTNSMITVFDVTGREVGSIPVTKKEDVINFNEVLNKGIYFIRLNNGDHVAGTIRVVKID